MFEHLVDSSPVRKKNKRFAYFAGTAVVWVTVLAAALAAGVVAYDASLDDVYKTELLMLPRPPVQLGRRGDGQPAKPVKPTGTPRFQSVREIPSIITASITPPVFAADIQVGPGDGPASGADTGTGDPRGVPDGIPVTTSDLGKTPEPPPITVEPRRDAQPVTRPLRRSPGVLQGSAIRRPEPIYPELARRAGISGQVVVEVVIDEKGNVVSARAVSGHLLLRQHSVDAAARWKWNPTYLGEVPVRVVGSITFNFNIR